MKFTIHADVLLSNLKRVAPVIQTRTTLPVLASVLLSCEGDTLTITGSNLDNYLRVKMPAAVAVPGAITLPCRLLSGILSGLNGIPAEFELKKSNMIRLKAGENDFEILGLPAEEFPPMPKVDGKVLDLDPAELLPQKALLSFAMCRDETRYVLNGVLLEIRSGQITGVATDGRRLARSRFKCEYKGSEMRVLVHKATWAHLFPFLDEEEDTVECRIEGETSIRFAGTNWELVGRLIEGNYPNYIQVMPEAPAYVAKINSNLMANAVKRLAPMTTDKTGGQSLYVAIHKDGEMLLTVKAPEAGRAQTVVRADLEGKPKDTLLTCFNLAFMLDALAALQGKTVSLCFVREPRQQPLVITDGTDNYCSLLIPVRFED